MPSKLKNSKYFSADEKSYNLQILGQPMFTWVTRACPAIPVTIEVNENVNPLEVIRPYLKDAEYTVEFLLDLSCGFFSSTFLWLFLPNALNTDTGAMASFLII